MPARRRTTSSPDEMSRLLVAIRGDLSQPAAAGRSGFSQSKISRAESGRFPFKPDEAERYARALNAPPADVRRLVELATIHAAENITSRAALVRSANTIQERVARYERDAKLIRSWQPEIVPGVLQSRAYTIALVGEVGEDWWKPRLERVALLHEPGRTWHQLMSEAALRWVLGSREAMAAQLRHLGQLMDELPWLKLGIVPLDVEHPVPPPAAFHLYDDRVAEAATETATAFLTQPADIKHYSDRFEELGGIAIYGDEARGLLSRLALSYGSATD